MKKFDDGQQATDAGRSIRPSGGQPQGPPSLYEAAFAERRQRKPWAKLPIGIMVFALVAVVTVVAYVFQPPGRPDTLTSPVVKAPESELSRVVEAVRKRDAESAGTEQDETKSPPEPVTAPGEAGVRKDRTESVPAAAEALGAAPQTPVAPPQPSRPSPTEKPGKSSAVAATVSNRPVPPAPAKRATVPAATSPSPSATSPGEATPVGGGATAASSGERPQLVRDGATESAAAVEAPLPEPGPSPAEQQAFEALKANSPVAQRLIAGDLGSLHFSDWRIVQENRDEYWVDLVCEWDSGGSEVHLIWAVSKRGGKVRAMSQAARNLESDYHPGK